MSDQLPITDEGRVLGLRLDLEKPAMMAANEAADPGLPLVDYDKLPQSAGVAKWMQIEDQQQQGSCRGHSTSTCLELAHWRETKGQVLQYSRGFSYYSGQKIDGIEGDQGSSMTGGAQAAIQFGIPLESEYQYPPTYPRGGWRSIPPTVWTAAKVRTLASYRMLRSYDEVMRWLVWGAGGVAEGCPYTAAWEALPDRIDYYDPDAPSKGGHATAILDWNTDLRDKHGRPYLDKFNSWRVTWGYHGRKFIHPDVIELIARKYGYIGYTNVLGEDIKPRPFSWLAHHHI